MSKTLENNSNSKNLQTKNNATTRNKVEKKCFQTFLKYLQTIADTNAKVA